MLKNIQMLPYKITINLLELQKYFKVFSVGCVVSYILLSSFLENNEY
ncbi:MAG: hypothetical protein FWD66_10590 [Paludibacter sp.]|nr:hypothetical protein [Paludibacter sp.]